MKYLVIALMSILFVPSSFGQTIKEEVKPMSQGQHNALVVILPDTEEKIINKEWERFMKDHKAKVRSVKKSDEVFSDDAKIESLSNNTVDVYSLVTQRGNDTEMAVWFDLGGGYLSSEAYPAKYRNAENLMGQFFENVSQTYIAAMVAAEEKKMKEMEKASKDNDKTQEKAEKDIEDYNEKIAEEQAKIEECKNKRVKHQQDIEAQSKKVASVKSQLKN